MTDRLRRMNGSPVLGLLRRDTPVRVAGGTVIAAVLGAGWWELLFLPLGASHDGRINGRFGLVVRNFVEGGLPGSDYLASMVPFSPDPYVHHPPLMNILHAAVGSVLGQGEWQLHAIGNLAGLGTVAGLLWLAGELDLGAGVSVVVMALVAATPMFCIYARLGLGVSLMVVFLALWYRYRRNGKKPRRAADRRRVDGPVVVDGSCSDRSGFRVGNARGPVPEEGHGGGGGRPHDGGPGLAVGAGRG